MAVHYKAIEKSETGIYFYLKKYIPTPLVTGQAIEILKTEQPDRLHFFSLNISRKSKK